MLSVVHFTIYIPKIQTLNNMSFYVLSFEQERIHFHGFDGDCEAFLNANTFI